MTLLASCVEPFLKIIVKDVVEAVHAKRFPVLLTERRDHLDALVDLFTPQIANVIVMAGAWVKTNGSGWPSTSPVFQLINRA